MRTSKISLLLLILFAASCNKDPKETSVPATPGVSRNSSPSQIKSLARYSGPEYSQSISLEFANQLIGSYLSSVKYPIKDTAIRSFAFDADTLRAYLTDTSIKTMRFYMAHSPKYRESSNGKDAGLNAKALTLIITGYSADDILITNKQSGVYEHCYPCPNTCKLNDNGFLQ